MGTVPAPDVPSFDALAGVDCVQSRANTPGIGGQYGETPPPGWERSLDGTPATFIHHEILSCGRIEWGALEREAHVLWELHESFTTPDSCREDGIPNYWLGTIWFDDPELVAQAVRLGMPAVLGSFTLDVTSDQDIDLWTWTWAAEGGDSSTLTVGDSPPDMPVTFTRPARYFWFTGNQANYYDNVFIADENQVGNPTATGTMAEPMLYANAGVSAYAGIGSVATYASFSGTLHRFSDLECKNEIPISQW